MCLLRILKAYCFLLISLLPLNQLTGAARSIVQKGGSLIDCSVRRIVDDSISKALWTPSCQLPCVGMYLKQIEQLPDKIIVQEIDFSANSIRLEGATQVLNQVKTWKQKEFKNLEKLDLSWNKLYEYSWFPEKTEVFNQALAEILQCDVCVDIRGNAIADESWVGSDFFPTTRLSTQQRQKLIWEWY